jgi:hypothetical protein
MKETDLHDLVRPAPRLGPRQPRPQCLSGWPGGQVLKWAGVFLFEICVFLVPPHFFFFFFLVEQYWDLNSGSCACLIGTPLLEPRPGLFGVVAV